MNFQSDEERNEKPTSHKIKKSKEMGILSYSRDVNSFFILFFFFCISWINKKSIIGFFLKLFKYSLTFNVDNLRNKKFFIILFFQFLQIYIYYLLFLFIGIFFILILLPILIYNQILYFNRIKISFDFLNIFKNIINIFSLNSIIEVISIFLKMFLFIFFSIYFLWNYYPNFSLFVNFFLLKNIELGMQIIKKFCIIILSMVFIISIIDFFLHYWKNTKKLRMTLREIKDEFKALEGNPFIKKRIFYTMKRIAKKSSIFNVSNADVVIIDIKKYAIVIKYHINNMVAPKILMKGINKYAKEIKKLSKNNNIPILLAPNLAKILYKNTMIGKNVPVFLYKPVAEALAWAWQVQNWKKHGGIYPKQPEHILVPRK